MPVYAWSQLIDRDDPGPLIVAVTPADGSDQTNSVGGVTITGYRALRANTAGTISVIMQGAAAAQSLNFAAGETRIGMFIRVRASGTTATGIEGHV
jgi:hypothetical protein